MESQVKFLPYDFSGTSQITRWGRVRAPTSDGLHTHAFIWAAAVKIAAKKRV